MPAEAFPPAEYIRDELEARGWTAADLASRSVIDEPRVQAILSGEYIRLDECERLAVAFGAGVTFVATLQLAWRSHHGRQKRSHHP